MENQHLVHNAGLIILSPFLPRYFEELGMTQNGRFTDDAQAQRAVLLTQYLASGQTESEEHLLVLNKILCGLPLETLIADGIIELSQTEKDISDQLLNAVIQNWDKLRNSTVENLRGSFILRTGLLHEQESHWQLRVENVAYDVLLQFLPWPIHMIKLPWMDGWVEVDWGGR